MKKALVFIFVCIMLVSAFLLVSCGDSKVEFKVNFIVDGETYSTINTNGNEVISIPQNPTKEGYTFDGWFWDEGTWQRPFTANSLLNEPLSSDMSVYAKWTEVSAEPEPTPVKPSAEISSSALTVFGEIATATLSNATQTFSFLNDITVADGATYVLATDIGCQNTIASKTVALEEGDNTYYILVTNGNLQKLYTVTIRRRPIYTVEFNTNGGTSVETLYVEEDSTIEMQQTSKVGYTFDGWTIVGKQIEFPYQVKKSENIVAKWSAIPYTIEYELNSGTNNTENVSNYTIEQTVSLNSPTRDYYTFAGWYDNESFEGTSVSEISQGTTGNKTFYAKWTPVQYEIKYELKGGTNDTENVNSYNIEQTISLNRPTREYYTFDGWYENESFEGTSVFEISQGTTGNKTFYAKWTSVQYEIKYELNGGTNNESNVFTYNIEQEITLKNPTRNGYAFLGWFINENFEGSAIEKIAFGSNGNKKLYAKWQACENKLVFDGNSATSGSMVDMAIDTDETVSLENNKFEKLGYTFKGWAITANGNVEYLDGSSYTMGTNNLYTLYAVWEANKNTIIFDANGGSGSMSDMTIATDASANLTNNTFTKAGYTFVGWSTTKDGEVEYADGSSYTMGTNATYTLYAVWTKNINGLIFNGNGATSGSMSSVEIATENTALIPNNSFIKNGYTFVGWSTTKDGEVEYADGASYTMGTNATYTLYAVWEAKTNTLVFNANGGSGSMSDMTIATDASTSLTTNAFTRKGYTFVGWSTTKDGEVEYANGAEYTMGTNATYTLYVVWEANEYTITYNKNGGTEKAENPVKFTIEDLPITLNDLSKANYLFNYWYKESDFSESPVLQIVDISDVELYAEYVECTDGISLTDANGEWTVSAYTGTATDVVIPKSYKGKNVTSIGSKAFYNCNSLTSVTIPSSVTEVGEDAFFNCSSLTSVNYLGEVEQWCNISFGNVIANPLSNGAKLYLNGTLVTGLVIPDTVMKIKSCAFAGCTSLTSVTIPNSVITIGSSAFYNCPIENATIPTNAISYIPKTKLKTVVINGGDTIKDSAFESCTSLTSITIPNSVTSIGSEAFYNCQSLTSVNYLGTIEQWCNISFDYYTNPLSNGAKLYLNGTLVTDLVIPNTVTEIKPYAFRGCTSLTNVTIPDSVTSIGSSAFYYCTSLTSITIQSSVTEVGEEAFFDCSSLTSVNYLGTIEQWCNISFGNVFANPLSNGAKLYLNGTLVTDLVIPDTIMKIKSCAFAGCTSLTSVTIGNGVTTIGVYAFAGCTSLASITIPDSVTTIGYDEFIGCTSLTIYCEAENQPSGWDSEWNSSNRPVEWGYTGKQA
ncbi:MAG: InlB B-repeat-containing protein [Clostridia bacterium]|nr:InlB B-repeat-containing protein [Clostridia bacterium]